MPNKTDQEIIEELMRRLARLEESQRLSDSIVPLYRILNVNAPAQLTADQNDYDPGNYDYLSLTSNASRTITGFSGGVEGRALWMRNNGANNIVLAHNSGASLAENRISAPGAVNVTLTVRRSALLVWNTHPTPLWRMFFFST